MKSIRVLLVAGAALCVVVGTQPTRAAQGQSQEPNDPAATIKAADALMLQTRYDEALDAYRLGRQAPDASMRVRAGIGAVRSLLRSDRFVDARVEAKTVASSDARQAPALAVYGDALWASGQFLEAEAQYAAALAVDPVDAGSLHGRGRSLASQHKFDAALADLEKAAATDPREPEYQFTLATTYEQVRRYPEAIAALTRYLNLLPHPASDDQANWARTEIDVLRGFGNRKPYAFDRPGETFTVPFRVDNGQIHVKGVINGRANVDFVVDTGAEHTVIAPAMAARAGVEAIASMSSAGVGIVGYGFRSLQVARIDQLEVGSLRVQNVTCFIKSPSLTDLPTVEGESFSPLDLGLSVAIDYEHQTLTMAAQLPAEGAETELPLRMNRLPMVRGLVAGSTPASFVVDTGGEAVILSRSMSEQLGHDATIRRVPLRVYGTSGWDPTAYMRPYVDVEFAKGVGLRQASVVVLNLDAPSAMLGFDLGGIVGHQLLSRYKVTIDLPRSLVGLQPIR